MTKDAEPAEMTRFGHELWSMIQGRGRISQAGIGRKIEEATGWKPSRQAINHWLYGSRDVPRDFVPAVAKAFDLTFEERCRLKELYFYGQGDTLEERYGRESKDPNLINEENRGKLREVKEEHAERHDQASTGEASDTGDRTT